MNTGNLFLDSLPGAVMRRLAFQLETVRVVKGQLLYLQGDTVNSVYFPLSAVVSKYHESEEGKPIEVALNGREGSVGMASAFAQRMAMHSCQVITGGNTMRIRTDYIVKIVEQVPELTVELIRSLNSQLRQMSRRVLCNRYHTVEQRLCTWMLMVSERSGRPSIRITHNDAARGLGVHRPTITDAMAILCEKGLIEQSTGRINILDHKMIRKLACDCTEELSMAAVAGHPSHRHVHSGQKLL